MNQGEMRKYILERYCELLNLSKGLSLQEIKNKKTVEEITVAFKQLSRKLHPDKSKHLQANELFSLNLEIFDELSGKKATEQQQQQQRQQQYYQEDGDFEQFFRGFTGGDFGGFHFDFGGRGNGRNQPGGNLKMTLVIPLETAVKTKVDGVVIKTFKEKIRFETYIRCEDCKGLGSLSSVTIQCPDCGGSGQAKQAFAFFSASYCKNCSGSGKVNASSCSACRKTGRKRGMRDFTIDIPKGINDEEQFICRGKGEEGIGAQAGDLIITIKIKTEPYQKNINSYVLSNFTRTHNDLNCELQIPMTDWILGKKISLMNLTGEMVDIDIPAFISPSMPKVLKNKGVLGLGSLNITIKVDNNLDSYTQEELKKIIRNKS